MNTYHLDTANAMNMGIYIRIAPQSTRKITKEPMWREIMRVSPKLGAKEKGEIIHTRREMRTNTNKRKNSFKSLEEEEGNKETVQDMENITKKQDKVADMEDITVDNQQKDALLSLMEINRD